MLPYSSASEDQPGLLINYLQWKLSKQTKLSIKSLQNKIKYLLLVKFFLFLMPFLFFFLIGCPSQTKDSNTRWVESAKLKVCALGSRIRRLHCLKVWLCLLYHAQGGKNLLSFYFLNWILAADLSVHHPFDRNETNHAPSFDSWSENADLSFGFRRLWNQPNAVS